MAPAVIVSLACSIDDNPVHTSPRNTSAAKASNEGRTVNGGAAVKNTGNIAKAAIVHKTVPTWPAGIAGNRLNIRIAFAQLADATSATMLPITSPLSLCHAELPTSRQMPRKPGSNLTPVDAKPVSSCCGAPPVRNVERPAKKAVKSGTVAMRMTAWLLEMKYWLQVTRACGTASRRTPIGSKRLMLAGVRKAKAPRMKAETQIKTSAARTSRTVATVVGDNPPWTAMFVSGKTAPQINDTRPSRLTAAHPPAPLRDCATTNGPPSVTWFANMRSHRGPALTRASQWRVG